MANVCFESGSIDLQLMLVFQVDSSLSFLDEFVSEALAAGAAPYKPPHQRQEELADGKGTSQEKNLSTVTDLSWPLPHCGVCPSVESGALRPVSAHQHVLLQHHRQTVAYTVVHELWSLRQQHRPLTQRRVCEH